MAPTPEPATLVTRNIPREEYDRLKVVAAARGISMEALMRQLIHELSEHQRLAERAEAMRAYDEDPDRPSFPPDELIEELRTARAQDEGRR
jgi:plasmid stability protein